MAWILSLLMVLTMAGCKGKEAAKPAAEQVQAPEGRQPGSGVYHTNAYGYESWSVHYTYDDSGEVAKYYYLDQEGNEVTISAEEVEEMMEKTILECADEKINNRMLQMCYTDYLRNFSAQHYETIFSMMDTTAPLDSQMNYETSDGTKTWQRTLLDEALTKYKQELALLNQAQEEGFVLTSEQERELAVYSDPEQLAMMIGMQSGQEVVQNYFGYGPTATTESYMAYSRQRQTAGYYLNSLAQSIELTEEDISAYYDANAQSYATRSIPKDDSKMVDVRHILIKPQVGEDGSVSKEAWLAAEVEANRILAEFKAGENTETAFGKLAETYSEDTGSSYYGGLCMDVYPGQMVQAFDDWCFDTARRPGNTGVIKSEYGYHVMYFVEQGEQVYWKVICEEELRGERLTAMVNEIVAKWEVAEYRDDMLLLDGNTPSKPTE